MNSLLHTSSLIPVLHSLIDLGMRLHVDCYILQPLPHVERPSMSTEEGVKREDTESTTTVGSMIQLTSIHCMMCISTSARCLTSLTHASERGTAPAV